MQRRHLALVSTADARSALPRRSRRQRASWWWQRFYERNERNERRLAWLGVLAFLVVVYTIAGFAVVGAVQLGKLAWRTLF